MTIGLRKIETVYRGYMTVMRVTLSAPDGSTFVREIEHHGHAACVLPYDPVRRCALLVSQARVPALWAGGPPELSEAPAGMVEDESPEDCVRREALEEAGVRLARLEPLGSAFASPGVSSERIELFLAAYGLADRVSYGGGESHEQEHITVVELPLDQLWAAVEQHRIEDLKTLALIFALRARRPDLFG